MQQKEVCTAAQMVHSMKPFFISSGDANCSNTLLFLILYSSLFIRLTDEIPATKIPATKIPAEKITAKKIPAKKTPAKKIPAKIKSLQTKIPAEKNTCKTKYLQEQNTCGKHSFRVKVVR